MSLTEIETFTSLEEAVGSLFGEKAGIAGLARIVGGDINEAYRLELDNGRNVFLKANRKENLSFFKAEAEGLRAIAKTEAIGVPDILCCGTDGARDGYAFLLLEFIASGSRVPDYWETFGHELAAMHRAETADFVSGGKYGFADNNYIGSRRQINRAYDRWADFFRDCRLEPQFRQAEKYFDRTDLKKADRLLERTADILTEPPYPSLLHGDLWSGNVMTGRDGRVWLIDPAAYVGHCEADLAMTELFGRLPQRFYDAYREAAPLQPGYEDRCGLYNLYHLLNHLNIFGQTYLSSVKRTMKKYA